MIFIVYSEKSNRISNFYYLLVVEADTKKENLSTRYKAEVSFELEQSRKDALEICMILEYFASYADKIVKFNIYNCLIKMYQYNRRFVCYHCSLDPWSKRICSSMREFQNYLKQRSGPYKLDHRIGWMWNLFIQNSFYIAG